MELERPRTGGGRVVVRWWREGQGYRAVDEELGWSAGGSSYEDLRQRVADSAEREGWGAWVLVADHAVHPYEPARRGRADGLCARCGQGPTYHVRTVGDAAPAQRRSGQPTAPLHGSP